MFETFNKCSEKKQKYPLYFLHPFNLVPYYGSYSPIILTRVSFQRSFGHGLDLEDPYSFKTKFDV